MGAREVSGRPAVLAAAGCAATVLVFWLARDVLGMERISSKSHDLLNYYYPQYEATFGWITSGRLPLWDPFHQAGMPWLATLQAGALYPLHLPYLILPTHLAFALSNALHLALFASTTALLGVRLGLAAPAAGLAALLFTLSGPVQFWLTFPSLMEAASWLPLGCVAVVGLARGGGRRAAALLALSAALSLLAGYTQATAFCVYVWGTLLAALLAGERATPRRCVVVSAAFAGSLALGALLSAVQTLPTFELTLEATRKTQALPRLQASGHGASASWLLSRAIAGSHNSFGPTALALAPAALWARGRRALALWALVLGGIAYTLALGSGTALVELYRSLPVIGWFRNPRRLLLVSDLCLALLAAITLDAILRRGARERGPAAVCAVCGAALGFAAAHQQAWPQAAIALAIAAVTAAAALRPQRLPPGAIAAALLVAAGCDGAFAVSGRGGLPYGGPAVSAYDRAAPLLRGLAARAGGSRVTWLPQRNGLALKLAPLYGVRFLDDYEPLTLSRLARYFTFLQHGRSALDSARGIYAGMVMPPTLKDQALPQWLGIAARRRLLDLAASRWLVMPELLVRRESARAFVSVAGLVQHPPVVPGTALFENPHALPRAFVTYSTQPAPPPDALLAQLADPAFDPFVTSFVEGDPGLPALPGQPPRGHEARIVRDEATLVVIDAPLVAPGLVVLADTFARGWHATVDGVPAPILATNHLFRGVPVRAGRHRVRFEYRPASLVAGALGTLAGLVALAVLARRPRPA